MSLQPIVEILPLVQAEREEREKFATLRQEHRMLGTTESDAYCVRKNGSLLGFLIQTKAIAASIIWMPVSEQVVYSVDRAYIGYDTDDEFVRWKQALERKRVYSDVHGYVQKNFMPEQPRRYY